MIWRLWGLSGSSSKKVTGPSSEDYGLELLASGKEPTLDIVMVHGLNGHRKRTWTTADGQVFWPKDLLPLIVPNARILSYGYDARTHSRSPLSQQSIDDHARALVTDLTLARELSATERRPIIFVAHSLGGLLLKSALIHSDSTKVGHLEKEKAIKLSTYGILFMGTPHQGGGDASLGKLVARAFSAIGYQTQIKVVKHLDMHSDWLQEQQTQYLGIGKDFVTKFFYETCKTKIPFKKLLIVPKYSAVIPTLNAQEIAVPGDHRTMVKYHSEDDEGFKKVSGQIVLMAKDAPKKVSENWVNWERIKEAGATTTITGFNIDFRADYARNGNFTGRIDILDFIHSFLKVNASDAQSRIVALHGPGGVGKTQVALEYVHKNHAAFSSVFLIDATSRGSARGSFLKAARRLVRHHVHHWRGKIPNYNQIAATLGMVGLIDKTGCISGNDSTIDEIVEAMLEWFEEDQNRDWLLVFDNADDLESFNITDFFPKKSWGSILITTRRPECVRFGIGIELEEMTQDEGLLMLKKITKCGSEIGAEEQDSAVKLVKKLGYLPLAIEQAGAYICVRKLPFAKYLQIYDHNKKEMLGQKPPNATWNYRNDTAFTTWEISFAAISDEDPESAELLLLCAWLANGDIWEDLIRRGRGLPENDITTQNHIQKLSSYSLVKYNSSCNSFSLHPLIHFWARERLSMKSQQAEARKAIKLMAMVLLKDYAGNYFDNPVIKHFDVSLHSFEKLSLNDTKLSTEDFHSTLQTFEHIGLLLGTQRRFDESLEWYQQALASRAKILGADHPSTLGTIKSIGLSLTLQERGDEAIKLYKRALAVQGKAFGTEHPSTLHTIFMIGLLFLYQKRYDNALEWLKRALAGQEKESGMDHPSTLETIHSIGVYFTLQGRYDEALGWFKRALVGKEKTLGTDHPSTLDTIDGICISFYQLEQYDEALEWSKRVLVGKEKTLGTDHPSTLSTIDGIGTSFYRLEQYDKALEWFKRALVSKEKTLGTDHSSTLDTVDSIGILFSRQRQYDEAFEWLQRVLAGREKIPGTDHPSTLYTAYNIGVLLSQQERYKEAIDWYKRALASQKKVLGEDHPSTLNTVYDIGAALHRQKRYVEALEWYKRALAGQEKLWGMNHPSTLDTVNCISALFSRQERYDEAMEWCERVLAIQMKIPGTEKPKIWKTILRMILITLNKNGCGHWRVRVII